MIEIKRVALYARFSSDHQRTESIDAQIRAMKEFCDHNKWKIVETYIDEAYSATNDRRPSFQRMIADSGKGLFDIVLVHKLDRFSRNRYDSAVYKNKLKHNGVRPCSVLERLDDSPESIILEAMLESIGEYYSSNIAREVMKGLKENAFHCKHTGGSPPLGYDVLHHFFLHFALWNYMIRRDAHSPHLQFRINDPVVERKHFFHDAFGRRSLLSEVHRTVCSFGDFLAVAFFFQFTLISFRDSGVIVSHHQNDLICNHFLSHQIQHQQLGHFPNDQPSLLKVVGTRENLSLTDAMPFGSIAFDCLHGTIFIPPGMVDQQPRQTSGTAGLLHALKNVPDRPW